jgi:hypothetical protein
MSVDKLAPRKSFSQSKSMRATVSDAENGFSNPAFNSDPSDGSNLEKSIPRASNSSKTLHYRLVFPFLLWSNWLFINSQLRPMTM